MKAKIIGFEKRDSKYGGHFFYIFFKDEDGKSYRTCADPKCRNFNRWMKLMPTDKEVWLEGLVVKKGNLIDADSKVEVCNDNS